MQARFLRQRWRRFQWRSLGGDSGGDLLPRRAEIRANLNRRIPVALTSHQPADDKRCRQPRPKKRGQHDANMHQIIP